MRKGRKIKVLFSLLDNQSKKETKKPKKRKRKEKKKKKEKEKEEEKEKGKEKIVSDMNEFEPSLKK